MGYDLFLFGMAYFLGRELSVSGRLPQEIHFEGGILSGPGFLENISDKLKIVDDFCRVLHIVFVAH